MPLPPSARSGCYAAQHGLLDGANALRKLSVAPGHLLLDVPEIHQLLNSLLNLSRRWSTAEAPPAAATFLQPSADLKAAPGKERKAERFPTARNSATNTSPSPPFPPPSSMLQTVTRAKLLRPRQLFSKRCVTHKLAAFVYKRNIEIGGEAQGGVPDLSTARVCHRRLQTLKLRHALARFMTSHTGASCTWSSSACFCCVFSILIPLSSSYSVLIPVLIPVLIHDFAGRATRTKLSVSRKKRENVFAFLKSIHRKLVSCGPASKTVNKNWNKNWNKN